MHRRHQTRRDDDPEHTRSFERLFHDHRASVRAFVARRVRPAEVDDVVAETFATLWRRRRDLPDDIGLHRAWLLRTANYTVLNQRRSRRRYRALSEKVAGEARAGHGHGQGDPYVAIASASDHQIGAVLDALSPADRLVLTLLAWDEVSVPELAEILGCSENAATTRSSRARARFRAHLEGRDRGPKRPA